MRSDIFWSSKQVLEGKARELRKDGKGKLPNRARSLSSEEENTLWKYGQLGDKTPKSLIATVWWNNCIPLGMRGREEHYDLKMEDFVIEFDDMNRKYITFHEGMKKTETKAWTLSIELSNQKCMLPVMKNVQL